MLAGWVRSLARVSTIIEESDEVLIHDSIQCKRITKLFINPVYLHIKNSRNSVYAFPSA